MTKKYENLEEAMCRELETLDKKYAGEAELSAQDVEKIDKLYHALKSAATYHAMKEEEGWEEKDASGRSSYRRGRDSMGRFASREYSGYPGGSGYQGGSGYPGGSGYQGGSGYSGEYSGYPGGREYSGWMMPYYR